MNTYQRDFSFYMRSHGGRASRFHFLGKDLASACGRARMLDLDHPMDEVLVPIILQCKAKGCLEKWRDDK